jgi:hypothetical protein
MIWWGKFRPWGLFETMSEESPAARVAGVESYRSQAPVT